MWVPVYSLPLLGAEINGVTAYIHRVLWHQRRRLRVLGYRVPLTSLTNKKPFCGQQSVNITASKSLKPAFDTKELFLSSWSAPSRFPPFFLRYFLFCSTISRSKMFPWSSVGDGEELAGLTAAIVIFFDQRSVSNHEPREPPEKRTLIPCFCKQWLLCWQTFLCLLEIRLN